MLIDVGVIIRGLTAMKKMYDPIALDGIIKALEKAPTVDAVEVVRCKDCKHWSMGYCNNFAYYSYEPITHEDDFCSYGERRNEDEKKCL